MHIDKNTQIIDLRIAHLQISYVSFTYFNTYFIYLYI